MGKFVILSVNDGMWSKWGAQYVAKAPLLREQQLVKDKIDAVAGKKAILAAIAAAGTGGTLVMNVGHGALVADNGTKDEGMFQMLPSGSVVGTPGAMDICGRNAASTAFVNVFYDEPKVKPNVSDIKFDEGQAPPPERLLRWRTYKEIGAAMKAQGLDRVILLSCEIGQSSGMMTKVAADWQTAVQAYSVELVAEEQKGDRTHRIIAHSVKRPFSTDMAASDLEAWRTEIPSQDMVLFSPPASTP